MDKKSEQDKPTSVQVGDKELVVGVDLVTRERLNQQIAKTKELEAQLKAAQEATQSQSIDYGEFDDDRDAQVKQEISSLKQEIAPLSEMAQGWQIQQRQKKAEAQLNEWFDKNGTDLSDEVKADMRKTYVDEIATGPLYDYVEIDRVADLAFGKISRTQVNKSAQEAKDQVEEPGQSAATAASGGTRVPSDALEADAGGGSDDPFAGIDPKNDPDWEEKYWAKVGKLQFDVEHQKSVGGKADFENF